MKRIFLALPLAPAFSSEIKAFLNASPGCAEGVTWVEADTVHVTLHYFGTTPDEKMSVIHEVAFEDVDEWLDEKSKNGFLIEPKIYSGLYFLLKSLP